ncbi:MAG: hypothetical protein U1A27_03295 [Phycisphaerae bacterium]
MGTPNFRLFDTQARFAALLGAAALLMVAFEGVAVFHNFDSRTKVIWHNPNSKGYQRFRQPFVMAVGGLTAVTGLVGMVMGFNSLGEKRNTKQRLSWLGLVMGGVSISLVAVLMFAWFKLALPIISS